MNVKEPKVQEQWKKIGLRVMICVAVLAVGMVGMGILAGNKKPPTKAERGEMVLTVDAIQVDWEDTTVSLEGFGTVHPIRRVPITPEVSGRVVAIHPRLEDGEQVPAGEVLVEIDDRDYQVALADARARQAAQQSQLTQLHKSFEVDQRRWTTAERNLWLAQQDFDRVKDLLQKDDVGSQAAVERSEKLYNQALDAHDTLSLALAVYPMRIREAESALARIEAQQEKAQADVDRCTLTAPFAARLENVSLEAGQVVGPGEPLFVLADDSSLEIQVPLNGVDVRQWMRFVSDAKPFGTAWFDQLEAVSCMLTWTQGSTEACWTGTLHRIVGVRERTRSVLAAVRVTGAASVSREGFPPLLDGMFCRVEIPGRSLEHVMRLPRWAVTLEDTVYVIREGRLRTVPVEVVRVEGDTAFVQAGLESGDQVVTTRLIDPLEGIRVQIREENPTPEADS